MQVINDRNSDIDFRFKILHENYLRNVNMQKSTLFGYFKNEMVQSEKQQKIKLLPEYKARFKFVSKNHSRDDKIDCVIVQFYAILGR